MILVTGATGNVGRHVVGQLREAGHEVRAVSRRSGVELTEPETVRAAAEGADAVFLLWAAGSVNPESIAALGGRRVVYLSAEGRPLMHGDVEDAIVASGAPHVFLRAGGFAANTLGWAEQLRRGDVVRWPFAKAGRSLVHEVDLAAVAVRALTDESLSGPTAMLTGPAVVTQEEQVAAIAEATGRDLRFEEVAPEEIRDELAGAFGDAGYADAALAHWATLVDTPEPVTAEVERLTGRPARTFAEWARDRADEFRRW